MHTIYVCMSSIMVVEIVAAKPNIFFFNCWSCFIFIVDLCVLWIMTPMAFGCDSSVFVHVQSAFQLVHDVMTFKKLILGNVKKSRRILICNIEQFKVVDTIVFCFVTVVCCGQSVETLFVCFPQCSRCFQLVWFINDPTEIYQ